VIEWPVDHEIGKSARQDRPSMMNHLWYFGVALALVPMMFRPAGAQQGPATVAPGTPASGKPAGPETLETINSDFERGVAELERRRLESLARLAAGQGKDEASKTYEAYFRLVITNGLYREAEPTAERVMKSGGTSPEVGALAVLTNIIAEADRGAYEESIASIASSVEAGRRDRRDGVKAAVSLPLDVRLTLIDAYCRKLTQAGQFEVARKALRLIRDNAQDAVIKDLAASRLKRLDMLGKPAPPIAGTDVDGKPVGLAGYKGDVVLVAFWASWCLPNAEEISSFEQVDRTYRGRGFRVLGINLDAAQDGGQKLETVTPNIRRFLLDHNVRWPNLINGPGDRDYAGAYGVTEIPANVLIGRDGTVVNLDLTRPNLEAAVAKAVGR
jgi:thiol-disulfide isomerase/thioredoxin